jgi:tRNA (guanine37-N1)-methyltransferase
MQIDVVTLFPEICQGAFSSSILARAQAANIVSLHTHDLRPAGLGRHRQVDDEPYGGGPGMVMRPEPIFDTVAPIASPSSHIILLSPAGRRFDQAAARRLAQFQHLILISGHYEGVDQRVADHLAHEELSIGDYVLTNGTLAATVIVDAVVRLLPGALGDGTSSDEESFEGDGLLDWPHYTRPASYRGHEVPPILLSGDHGKIAGWRRQQALLRTAKNRPDLLPTAIPISPEPRQG